jgi:hypothetical protein
VTLERLAWSSDVSYGDCAQPGGCQENFYVSLERIGD